MAENEVWEKPLPKKKPKKLCSGIRRDLKLCMLEADCVKVDKQLPITCLKEGNAPHQCTTMAYQLFECKRQFVDMRMRFRPHRGY